MTVYRNLIKVADQRRLKPLANNIIRILDHLSEIEQSVCSVQEFCHCVTLIDNYDDFITESAAALKNLVQLEYKVSSEDRINKILQRWPYMVNKAGLNISANYIHHLYMIASVVRDYDQVKDSLLAYCMPEFLDRYDRTLHGQSIRFHYRFALSGRFRNAFLQKSPERTEELIAKLPSNDSVLTNSVDAHFRHHPKPGVVQQFCLPDYIETIFPANSRVEDMDVLVGHDMMDCNVRLDFECGELYDGNCTVPLRVLYRALDSDNTYLILSNSVLLTVVRCFNTKIVTAQAPPDEEPSDLEFAESAEDELAPREIKQQDTCESDTDTPVSPDEGSSEPEFAESAEEDTRTNYIRAVKFRKALQAFRRLGFKLKFSHHVMVTHNGMTVRFCNSHTKDEHIVRKCTQDVMAAFNLPYSDFVEAL